MALALGGRNVEELKAATTYREFLRWLAYWEIESPGETNANWQIARVGAAICRALGAKLREDYFMPDRRRRRGPRRKQSEADSLAAFEAATRTTAPRRPPKGA